ncbi:perlucin-like protein [Mercenaria mercenaria]|uniref:perlucin-like protein n=1 Tax=Mercenaria mercenaria TaxID=6596 RepID=UPI00234E60BE|nr:perlucin-like protein [Mercenaria mercenaria]
MVERLYKTMLLNWIVLILSLLFYEAFSCPDGWSAQQSSCYHFSHDKEAWANAVTICQVLGGHVVEIEDATENQYLVSQAKIANTSFWIGLNDLQEEGTWAWVNSKAAASYTNWAKGQPDNDVRNENCALITKGFNFLWNDAQCYSLQKYICEKTAENTMIVG